MKGLFSICLLYLSLFSFGQVITWDQTYNFSQQDYGFGIVQTADGGYVMTGYSGDYYDPDLLVMKLDENGTIIWTMTYTDEGHSAGYSIVHAESGFIISGFTSPTENYYDYKMFIMKIDESGDTLWTKTIGIQNMLAVEVVKTFDNNYVVLGRSSGFFALRSDLYKFDEDGNEIWSKSYYTGNGYQLLHSLKQTTDNGLILSGESNDQTYYNNMMIMKVNQSGDSLWTKHYGGIINNGVACAAVPVENDEYIIAATEQIPNYSKNKLIFFRIDNQGNKLWEKSYFEMDYSFINQMRTTNDGFLIASGTKDAEMFVLKLDMEGDTIWARTFDKDVTSRANDIHQTSDDGFIVCGGASAYTGAFSDIFILKLDESGLVDIKENNAQTKSFSLRNFPNPFQYETRIEFTLSESEQKVDLEIYDMSGKTLMKKSLGNLHPDKHIIQINGFELPDGLLFYSLKSSNLTQCGKMLKVSN